MKKRFCIAVLVAISFHVILATVIGVYLRFKKAPGELERLDMTSVEIEISQEETFKEQKSSESALTEISTPVAEIVPTSVAPTYVHQLNVLTAPSACESVAAIVPPEPQMPPMDMPSLPQDISTPKNEPAAQQEMVDSLKDNKGEKPEDNKEEAEAKEDESKIVSEGGITGVASSIIKGGAKIIGNINPLKFYPRESRSRHEEGCVRLRLSIDARGVLEHVDILSSSGFERLDNAAIRAVKSVKYLPLTINGEAKFSFAEIELKFELD